MAQFKPQRSKQSGFTLVLAVIIIIFLTVVVVQVRYTTRVEWVLTQNAKNGMFSSYTGRSTIPLILEKLKRDMAENAYDAPNDMWAQEMNSINIGDQTVSIKIIDEDGKFNINYLVDQDGVVIDTMEESFVRLINALDIEWEDFEELDSTEDLIDKIIDYVDEDESGLFENNGNNPNRRIMNIDELLNVEGITPLFLYGEEDPFSQEEELRELEDDPYANLDDRYGLDDEEEPFEGLYLYITSQSRGVININSAEAPVLMSISADFTQDIAEAIVSYRNTSMENPDGETNEEGEVKMEYQIFTSINDITKIEDVDEEKLTALLDAIAPKPKNNNNNGDDDDNNGDDDDDNGQQVQRTTNRIDVSSQFFKAVVETNMDGEKEIYIGLFQRDANRVRLISWERNVSIPKRSDEDDEYHENRRYEN